MTTPLAAPAALPAAPVPAAGAASGPSGRRPTGLPTFEPPAAVGVTAAAALLAIAVALMVTIPPRTFGARVVLGLIAVTPAVVAGALLRGDRRVGGAAGVLAFVCAAMVAFAPQADNYASGASIGALYGLLAVGIILIYRSARAINFAAAGLGAVPGIGAILLQVAHGVPYAVALPLCLVTSAGIGALVEVVLVRRFAKAPRLILTVATIGIAQLLALLGIYVRLGLGNGQLSYQAATPWRGIVSLRLHGRPALNGDEVFTILAVALASLGLGLFFTRTRLGIAVRASAENSDRAALLGIPVRLVGTVAWAIAATFAGLCIFVRSSLVGVPLDGSLGYAVLVYALAAAVIARMDSIPTALVAGMGVGIIEQASVTHTGSNSVATATMLLIILGALITQRRQIGRALDVGSLSFQAVRELRPVPSELRDLPEVRAIKAGLVALVAALAVAAPFIVGGPRTPKLTLLPIEAMIAVSLVLLTGWAGQISLGQYGFVGIGAGVAGGLAANHNVDFFVAMPAGILAGALLAVAIGVPALRVPGLYLAVTTLAFAAAVEGYILRSDEPIGSRILPKGEAARARRPLIWGRIDTSNDRTYYYVCLAFLVLAILAASSFRRNRSGRVLIAVRDNQRAAPAYGINLARTKLAAFAVSGGIAAAAGVLLAYQLGAVNYQTYGIDTSIFVFVTTVVGGLTSLTGGVLGVVVFKGLNLFGSERLSLFATGVGLLVVLLFLPGGLAEALYRIRDGGLRRIADRRGILVPSLVADRRIPGADEAQKAAEEHAIEAAEERVVHAESFDVHARDQVRCPVCGLRLPLAEAPDHEHLRAPAEVAAGSAAASDGDGLEVLR